MRRLAGCVALAMMLGSSPLAAEQGPVAPEATRTAEPGPGKPASSGALELTALPLQEQLPPSPPTPAADHCSF